MRLASRARCLGHLGPCAKVTSKSTLGAERASSKASMSRNSAGRTLRLVPRPNQLSERPEPGFTSENRL